MSPTERTLHSGILIYSTSTLLSFNPFDLFKMFLMGGHLYRRKFALIPKAIATNGKMPACILSRANIDPQLVDNVVTRVY